MKTKMTDFTGIKIRGSETVLPLCYHIVQPIETRDCSSSVVLTSGGALLAKMGIKLFNRTSLLDFPNVFRPNESNPIVKQVILRRVGQIIFKLKCIH